MLNQRSRVGKFRQNNKIRHQTNKTDPTHKTFKMVQYKLILFLIVLGSTNIYGIDNMTNATKKYEIENTTNTTKRYTDKYDAYHALRWAYTNSESPNSDEDGDRVACIEPNANTVCSDSWYPGWNLQRQHYGLTADDALFGTTVVQFYSYVGGYISCNYISTGAGPQNWQIKDSFYAINSSNPIADGWPRYFTTSSTTYKLRRFYIWSTPLYPAGPCSLITPYSDTAPSGYEYTYQQTINAYFTGGSSILTGTAGAGVVAAFQADNRLWTQHESLNLDSSGLHFTCWKKDGGLCAMTGTTWRQMRNVYIASTNDPAYAGYVTVYNVCQSNTGYLQYLTTIGCIYGYTSIGTPILITDRSIWPDTMAKPGGGTWEIVGFQLLVHNTNGGNLIIAEGDRGPSGYTRIMYFWAYW